MNKKVIFNDIDEIIANDLPWETLKNSTVLVSGASGMIPSYIIYTILGLNRKFSYNIKVIGLVRNLEKAKRVFSGTFFESDIIFIESDVNKKLDIKEDIDYIFHGASPARPIMHKNDPVGTAKANTLGTLNLLDMAVHKRCKGFIFMSSSEVYGKTDAIESIKEGDYGYIDILNPRSCYTEGKRMAETICACYQEQYGVDCNIARFAHIYGPGLALDDGRVQAEFAANVIHGENIIMKSDGSAVRAYTYVADAVCGMFFALLLGDEIAYNIANSGSIVSIRQMAETFVEARPEKKLKLIIDIPEESKINYNPARFIGLDSSRLLSLGWDPKIDLVTGINRMLSYYE